MIIGEHEIHAPVTVKVLAYCEEQLTALRRLNDSDHDAVKTAWIRGQIQATKKLQRALTPVQPLEAAAENRNPYA